MMNNINYGFGKEYLPKWTIKEALREVFQNYIDFGKYTIKSKLLKNGNIKVIIRNDYIPESLEFLRIGNTYKKDPNNAIGHHGEGLKIAFLIFLRENLHFSIISKDFILYPKWTDSLVGSVLTIERVEKSNLLFTNGFVTIFECSKDIYESFINNIITDKDILYSNYNGSIVDKPIGNIYSGRLFVCNVPDLNYAYDIKPCNLELDRDRCIPKDWDIMYHCSKVQEGYLNKVIITETNKNYNAKDFTYISTINNNIANDFKLITVRGKSEFLLKKDNTILKNSYLKTALLEHPSFIKDKKKSNKDTLIELRLKTKRKSILTLLKEFKTKYCTDEAILNDITIIIERIKVKK